MEVEMNKFNQIEARFQALLDLSYKTIAVRLIFDEDEYVALPVTEPLEGKINYCQMVRAAGKGNSIKATAKHFHCLAGASTIGLIEFPQYLISGRGYYDLKMYCNFPVARDIAKHMAICKHKAYGILVEPLEKSQTLPDVIIVVTSPYNAMRIVQGYSFEFGTNTTFQMTGNQAFCSECTAYPIEHNRINMSILCSGTRMRCGWKEDELAIGLPFQMFEKVLNGIRETVNPVESNENKLRIEERLRLLGEEIPVIEMNRNYWTNLAEQQKKQHNKT
jgi:uncharacterized protein (DUF169 family)